MSGEVREQTDLATWLLACVADDERVASEAANSPADHGKADPIGSRWENNGGLIVGEPRYFSDDLTDYQPGLWDCEGSGTLCMAEVVADHCARWDPARVLAECDTKRRIIAMFPTSAPKTDGEGNFEGFQSRDCGEHRTVGGRAWCHDCGEWCYPDAPCVRCHGVSDVLRLLALPYRDRDGYRAEWSPDGR